MAFTFLAQIPNTPENNSPTAWRDENGDLIVQGYKATEEDYMGRSAPDPPRVTTTTPQASPTTRRSYASRRRSSPR